jgi:hypothetical protein
VNDGRICGRQGKSMSQRTVVGTVEILSDSDADGVSGREFKSLLSYCYFAIC